MNKHLSAALAGIVIPGIVFAAYALFTSLPASLISFVLLIVYSVVFFRIGKKIEDRRLDHATVLHLTIGSLALAFAGFSLIALFVLVLVLSLAFVGAKTLYVRDFLKVMFIFILVYVSATMMLQPTIAMAQSEPPVLDNNWWDALNWIKNNTDQCAVVATYWDPGHFIRGIANRPVVFDGASQNALWNTTVPANYTTDQIRQAAVIDKYTVDNTTNGQLLIQTARIQDVTAAMMTDNESYAVDILNKFRLPNCSSVYFLDSSDLIGKSYWWTYFNTWNPVDLGCATPMSELSLAQARPGNGGVEYVFSGGITQSCNQQVAAQIVVTQENDSVKVYGIVNNQLEPVEEFAYYTSSGVVLNTDPNATFKGLVILDPSNQAIVYVPDQIKDSMFTRQFFFNGAGLSRFYLVNQWGGEIKLFKVDYNTTGG